MKPNKICNNFLFHLSGNSQFVPEASDATLFRFYPLLHGPRTPHIPFGVTVRMCHLQHNSWINASSGKHGYSLFTVPCVFHPSPVE